jgi:hypothetical protein
MYMMNYAYAPEMIKSKRQPGKQSFEHAYQTIFPGCNINGIIEVGAGKNWSEAGSEAAIINIP